MITVKELATKVNEMRQAQNDYFKTKTFVAMDKAKKLERDVDGMVKAVLTHVDATQPELFNSNK